MIFGYYLAGGILMGGNSVSFAISAFSIPANVIQYFAGFILATLLTAALAKTPLRVYLTEEE
jgi:uncharacterized membrane protein